MEEENINLFNENIYFNKASQKSKKREKIFVGCVLNNN